MQRLTRRVSVMANHREYVYILVRTRVKNVERHLGFGFIYLV